MNKSLYIKIVLIFLVLILSMMTVVGAFLMNEIRAFYLQDFYTNMKSFFETPEIVDSLRNAADENDAVSRIDEIISAYKGILGIDSGTRNYYILSGETGSVLGTTSSEQQPLFSTPNILTAISGEVGSETLQKDDFMDVAVPISGKSGSYIIYIIDNKSDVSRLNHALFKLIAEAMIVGIVIAVLISLILAKTIVKPIQNLTRATEKVAAGDFSERLEAYAPDEIGVLTNTFNDMAGQLEKTLDELNKSEETRRQFVANVSHELRTPITNIRSYAETIQDNPELPQDTEQSFLDVIVKESDRMAKIVQDLLTLSRFDAGSITFKSEKFSIEQTIRDVYSAMGLVAKNHRHKFTLEIKNKIPLIIGDRDRIQQVLVNMVSNAIKYTRDGGSVNIIVSANDNFVICSVKDNGIGIPEEDTGKVFDRFYRVDKARSRESGGTGLGLSISKEIVTKHGGTLELQSKAGKGTTITMTLPVKGTDDEK